jgi:hypothetical protein
MKKAKDDGHHTFAASKGCHQFPEGSTSPLISRPEEKITTFLY